MRQSLLYRTLRLFFFPLIKLLFLYDVKGKENIQDFGRVILCPNHTSMADPILLAMVTKRQIFYMGKAELFKIPIIAKFLKALGGFPVKRGKGDNSALDRACYILDKDGVLGLFIEGTRSKTGEFLKPKTGVSFVAYASKAPVIPVCISGKNGGRVKPFRRNTIHIGKPLSLDELSIKEGKGTEFRNSSRTIMGKIQELSPQR